MPLTPFVRNVEDLSDDGGFKFRFKCDRCGSGVESQYLASKSNVLKAALRAFTIFRPLPGSSDDAIEGIDRGLRGKERDAAYERAVHEAMVHFQKCAACGQFVCMGQCWNAQFGMCEACAPDQREGAARRAAELARDQAVRAVETGGAPAAPTAITCPVCQAQTQGGKFCAACGAPLDVAACQKCGTPLPSSASFCPGCGTRRA